MMGTILGIVGLAVLFVVFALVRPRGGSCGTGGCGACSSGTCELRESKHEQS
jgi:hypothetical protein